MVEERYSLEKIGAEMTKAKVITHDQLAVAMESRRNLGGNLGQILVRKGFATEEKIATFFKTVLHVPFLSLQDAEIDPEMLKLVPPSLAKKFHFIPFSRNEDVVTIAMSNPLDIFAIDEFRDALKYQIQPMLASEEDIDRLLQEHFSEAYGAAVSVQVIPYGGEAKEEASEQLREMASGTKVIAQVNRIIQDAFYARASDIHIEPMADCLKIRDRIDGVLEERFILPKSMHLPLVSRMKVMANMDIAERRVPQDGRVRLSIQGDQLDLRISTYPAMHGEKVVIRLLHQGKVITLEQVGFVDRDRERFEDLIERPHGILLVTGPTGSGKTTTLYAVLQRINSQDKNIISIEDPIENEIAGVNQAQVNLKAGMTFAAALRSILRQDPDVIMIGEIRDRETADISVRAAITGHLVFSTLHTNTAIGAVSRLHDLGVEPFLISSGLIGVIAQRLLRRICPECRQASESEPEKLKKLGLPAETKLFRGKGCKRCRMTGYAGRIGVFEFVIVTKELRQLIDAGAKEEVLMEAAKAGGCVTLRERALENLVQGLTTIDEVFRMTEGME
ncbi:MAG: type II/IV secretion system protein [Deltaproteobacteria bacterium]|nr:type II/IV secretion system protein [Deltaproteobacteria bacterium]